MFCPQPSIEHFWATLAQTKLCEAFIHLGSKDKNKDSSVQFKAEESKTLSFA